MTTPISFYFDFISPFGYFASLRIDELGERFGRKVDWISMLLGVSVLKVMNIPPIVELPLKGPYVIRDAARYARRYGVPLERSSRLPVSRPVEAGRAFAWARSSDPQRAKRLAARIFESYFVQCLDIADAEVLHGCFDEAGLDWHEFQKASADGSPAALLRANVDRSLKRGVFGSPFFIVDEEPFFGVEKLPVVEEWLATGGW